MSWALNGSRVPVEQIRPAILRTGIPTYELATRMGRLQPRVNRPGSTPYYEGSVRWYLGIKVCWDGRRNKSYTARTVPYDMAVQMVKAAGLDPVDVGL